jgi:hypothetical protein
MENRNDEKIELKPKIINFNVNGMPEKVFIDWNNSCIENYGDSRWVKMFSDHQKAKQYDDFVNLYSRAINEIDELKSAMDIIASEIENIKKNISSEKSGVQTLGGNASE